jgi:hypothetical protein
LIKPKTVAYLIRKRKAEFWAKTRCQAGKSEIESIATSQKRPEQDGSMGTSFEVTAMTVKFLSSKNSGSDESEATAEAADETDIPFWRQPKRSENDTEPEQCRCCPGSVVSHR